MKVLLYCLRFVSNISALAVVILLAAAVTQFSITSAEILVNENPELIGDVTQNYLLAAVLCWALLITGPLGFGIFWDILVFAYDYKDGKRSFRGFWFWRSLGAVWHLLFRAGASVSLAIACGAILFAATHYLAKWFGICLNTTIAPSATLCAHLMEVFALWCAINVFCVFLFGIAAFFDDEIIRNYFGWNLYPPEPNIPEGLISETRTIIARMIVGFYHCLEDIFVGFVLPAAVGAVLAWFLPAFVFFAPSANKFILNGLLGMLIFLAAFVMLMSSIHTAGEINKTYRIALASKRIFRLFVTA